MMTLDQITQKYQIDQTKENFPLNTIRLLYLILIETLADNPDSTGKTMLEALPIIRDLLEKRTQVRLSGQPQNLTGELAEVQPVLAKLQQLLPNQQDLQLTIEHLFAYALPIQETVLFGIVSRAQSSEKIFSSPDVTATLSLRSMDSLIYSQILVTLLAKPEHNLAIHYLVNTVYQINDLIDSIIFAQEDTNDNNFSAFEVIRKAVPDSQAGKVLIKNNLSSLVGTVDQIQLPQITKDLVKEYLDNLIQVLGENFLSSPEPTSETPNPPPSDQA